MSTDKAPIKMTTKNILKSKSTVGNVDKKIDNSLFGKITEEKWKSEQTEMHVIKDTPLNLLRDGNKWYIVLGTVELDNEDEAEKLLKRWENPNWKTILILIMGHNEIEKKKLYEIEVETEK